MSTPAIENTVTVPEAAERLKVSEQSVRKLCAAKKVQARQAGRSWLIDLKSLEKFASGYEPRQFG